MSDDSTATSDYEHLFIVSYEDETERKRVEYLFNNWDEGDISRPQGVVRVTSGVAPDELYEKLLTKVPEDRIAAYELDRTEPEVTKETRRIKREINAPKDTVESFIQYVFSKRKAVLQSSERNEYEVVTKKGRADVRYSVSSTNGTTTARIVIEGYEPTLSFLQDFFQQELNEFSASQQ